MVLFLPHRRVFPDMPRSSMFRRLFISMCDSDREKTSASTLDSLSGDGALLIIQYAGVSSREAPADVLSRTVGIQT